MSNKVRLTNKNRFFIYEGKIHEVMTNEDKQIFLEAWVGVVLNTKTYLYRDEFVIGIPQKKDARQTPYTLCEEFVNNVKKVGFINLDKWNEFTQNESSFKHVFA